MRDIFNANSPTNCFGAFVSSIENKETTTHTCRACGATFDAEKLVTLPNNARVIPAHTDRRGPIRLGQ